MAYTQTLERVTLELTGNVLVLHKKTGRMFGSNSRYVEVVELPDGAALALRRALNNMEATNG